MTLPDVAMWSQTRAAPLWLPESLAADEKQTEEQV